MAEEGLDGAKWQQQQGVHYLAQEATGHRIMQHHCQGWRETGEGVNGF